MSVNKRVTSFSFSFFFLREHTWKVIPDVKTVYSMGKKKMACVCNNHAAYSQSYIFD